MKEDEMNESSTFTFLGVELPKVELPKVEMPKFEMPKFEMPKVEMPKFDVPTVNLDGVNTAFGAVKTAATTAAKGSYSTATDAAVKVRQSARHTVTLVREAIGV